MTPLLGGSKSANGLGTLRTFSFFLALGGLFAFVGMCVTIANLVTNNHPTILPPPGNDPIGETRRVDSYLYRTQRAYANAAKPLAPQTPNGDEAFYPTYLGSYSKGLQHDSLGQVEPAAYQEFVRALNFREFDKLPLAMGADMKFANPQGALAFNLIGADATTFTLRAPPAFNSSELAAEYVENAWMAVLRDIPFSEYGTNPIAIEAAAELDTLGSSFTGPRPVTTANLFRGLSPGCEAGPYLSQFFYKPFSYGAHTYNLLIYPHAPGNDFMTDFVEYLNIQNGKNPTGTEVLAGSQRYMINGRDLGHWVHIDQVWQAYLMAGVSLLDMDAPYNPTNPYLSMANQDGFATFGVADVLTSVAEVAKYALRIVKYQKWFVHRRMRPEAFGARIHVNKTMMVNYPIHSSALDTAANGYIFTAKGSYLLPQAFPEGCPMHPAYGAGHGTVAGACATVLKAFFDGSWYIPNPVEPNLSGSALVPASVNMTVTGEINKLANNVAIGRNIAGVHWRSDATESLKLGEAIAIDYLRDIKGTYHEPFTGWRFQRFDGTEYAI